MISCSARRPGADRLGPPFPARTVRLGARVLLRVVLTMMTLPLPAHNLGAQEPPIEDLPIETPIETLPTVLVTATRTEKDPFEVPASASVVTAATIEHRQATTLDDVLRDMPSVEMAGGPRAVAETITIRGLGGDRVVVRLDGARQNLSTGHKGRFFVDPSILKQVDVVRGPQSALYGSGALGGVLNLTTVDASDLLQAGRSWGARVTGGFQSANLEWLQTTTLFAEPRPGWEILGSFTWRDSDDLRTGNLEHTLYAPEGFPAPFQADEIPYSAETVWNGFAKTSVRFAEHHRTAFSAVLYRQSGVVPFTADALGASPTESIADRDTLQDTFTLQYQFDEPGNPWFDVDATLYYTTSEIEERDITGPSPFTGLRPPPRTDVRTLDTIGFDVANTVRLSAWDEAVTLAFTFGADGTFDEQTGRRNGLPLESFPDAEDEIVGAFAQAEFRFFDRVALTPAIRYDRYRLESTYADGPNDHEAWSPKITLAWDVTPELMIYGTYSEAFRAPSLNETFLSGVHFVGNVFVPNLELQPETAHNMEAGFTYRREGVFFSHDAVRARFAVFENTVDDFIETILDFSTFPGTTRQVNLSKARIHGVEGELFYDAEAVFGSIAFSALRGDDETRGEPLRSIPADKISFTLGTRLDVADLIATWRTDLVAAQGRLPLPYDQPTTEGYDLHNIYLTWDPDEGPLRFARADFAVENITDARYRRHLSTVPEAGRNFKLSVTLEF